MSPIQIDELIGQLTLEEKVSLMAGADTWHTIAVERLGIPALKMSDGPNGARGDAFTSGVPAAAFPAGVMLASTWNTDLVSRVGRALAQEAKTKGAGLLLAPTVNIHRSPLGGRNFESFSEDPHLAARMTVAYINGLQSEGVGATVKHYIGNEEETERFTMSSEMDERTLREIYLPPFEAAVREARTWAVMASYNRVNGVAVSESPRFLEEILRNEWGWNGVVVSDWYFSVKSTAPSVNAGLDIEMPGPGMWRGEKLLQAVRDGKVQESALDRSVRRLLLLLEKAGKFDHLQEAPERAVNLPEHRALIRQAAGEGIVLLKNERNTLPLQREAMKSIAIIGPNAKVARIMGGGSAHVNTHYEVTPFDGVMSKVGTQTRVRFEQGCTIHKLLPLADKANLLAGKEGKEPGLRIEYFNAPEPSGQTVHMTTIPSSEMAWHGKLPENVDRSAYAIRATGRFVPEQSGSYIFGLTSAGLSRLAVDGRQVIDNWTDWAPGGNYYGMGSDEKTCEIELSGGREHTIEIEFVNIPGLGFSAWRFGLLPPMPADMVERAVSLAAESDVALIFAGLSGEWDSEGFDRPNLSLPRKQDELIARVAAANRNTVVVINAGSAISMPWLNQVAAVVYAWYPGQEAGNAIADVLFGDINPSGKLPDTFPVRLEDTSSYVNFPGENGKVLYGERIFVGYRYYDKKRIEPLFPFGFGLSYTTFEYRNLRLNAAEIDPSTPLLISIDLTNTGSSPGQEIVQVYVRDIASHLVRPEKELKAFAKVALEPGETRTVKLPLGQESLAYYDDSKMAWVAESGQFEVLVGSSSRDIRARATFTLRTDWIGPRTTG